jgi:hypothetical protein
MYSVSRPPRNTPAPPTIKKDALADTRPAPSAATAWCPLAAASPGRFGGADSVCLRTCRSDLRFRPAPTITRGTESQADEELSSARPPPRLPLWPAMPTSPRGQLKSRRACPPHLFRRILDENPGPRGCHTRSDQAETVLFVSSGPAPPASGIRPSPIGAWCVRYSTPRSAIESYPGARTRMAEDSQPDPCSPAPSRPVPQLESEWNPNIVSTPRPPPGPRPRSNTGARKLTVLAPRLSVSRAPAPSPSSSPRLLLPPGRCPARIIRRAIYHAKGSFVVIPPYRTIAELAGASAGPGASRPRASRPSGPFTCCASPPHPRA